MAIFRRESKKGKISVWEGQTLSTMNAPNIQNDDYKEKIWNHVVDSEHSIQELLVICQPTKLKIMNEANIEEMVLDLK